ncbi:unnamed protein product [Triticum turgidum subsp. durum]|uniref:Disease resistance protein RPM1 n=1 Tax=Triticum turgidum subsp. durum TaxID=4567 RepID=A0A9R0WZ42_TRITD|nr:unnamed protein product [Triticum turgidum subsp. durum]
MVSISTSCSPPDKTLPPSFHYPRKRATMEGAAQTIVGTVGRLLGEEFRQLRAVGHEVVELRDELATMNALLRMQAEAEDGAVDHFIREWMKQLRELAYDAEDCVDLYIFRIKCRFGDGFLAWSNRLLVTFFPRRRLAGEIKSLRARAVSISERHARYSEALRRSPALALMPTASASELVLRPANDPDQLVGIQDEANTLAEMVKARNDEEVDSKPKVFSILGFGGLGKTTLAMEVYRLLEAEFEHQAQVSVSQAFDGTKDIQGLLKRVLRQIIMAKPQNEKEENIGDVDVMNLARKLKEHLADKRYIIVIDDVWTTTAWDAIRVHLPDSKCGSRIIVTTRIETVAKECSSPSVSDYYIYRLKRLKTKYSKELFLSRAFGSMTATCPNELKVIMDNILKKCDGLPLAIVSIASLLANYKSPERKSRWETICNSIGSLMESNSKLEGMKQILTLSYNHLPYHLKVCMMYLSIFPEDYEINKNRLLYRWIAEGLVEEKRGLTLLKVAEAYYDELVSRSMISPAFSVNFYGKVEACRVHDIMVEVLVSKSLEANFVSLVGGQFEGMLYDRARRLSIQGVEQDPTSKKRAAVGGKRSNMGGMDLQHVRSLSNFELQGQKLLDRLHEFTLLRVLDLEDCKGLENKHVKDICRLYLLKFLSMKGTCISVIPKKVGKLEHLEVLDVRETNIREKIPDTVTNLQKLVRMDLCHEVDWWAMWHFPKGLSKMKALCEVERALVSNVEVAKQFGQLGQLCRIYLFVDAQKDPKVLQEVALSLSKLYSLRYLSIARMGGEGTKMDFILELETPPRLLRYFYIDGQVSKLPDWMIELSYLTAFGGIWLNLRGEQLYGALCKLPNLQTISLWQDCYIDQKHVARTEHKFPALKTLALCSIYCHNPEVIEFTEGSMDMLEELTVRFCERNSRRSIVGIQHLKNLKEVQLRGMRDDYFLDLALKELNTESNSRPKGHQFKIGVRYD